MISTFSRYLKFFLFLMMASGQTFAQEQWQWLNPTLNGNRMNNLNLISGTDSIVVSYNHGLLISTDNGRLWTLLPLNFQTTKVIAPTPALSFALTTDGKILKNVFSGSPRIVHERNETEPQFQDITLDASSGVGFAVGGYEVRVPFNGGYTIYNWGIVAKTTDFGEHWTIVYNEQGDKLKKLIELGDHFIAYGTERYNYVVQSNSDGSAWEKLAEFGLGGNYIKGLQFVNETTGFLTYENDHDLYYTKDGGANWQLKKEFTKYPEHISISGSTIVMLTSNSLLISTDEGNNWVDKKLAPNGIRLRELVSDQDRIMVNDQDNGLLLSANTNFDFTNLNKNFNRLAIERDNSYFVHDGNRTVFTSAQIGYTINSDYNGNHTLVKTTDGGCSWQLMNRIGGYYGAEYLYFLNDLVGFASAGGSSYSLLKTADGGRTWTTCKVGSSSDSFISIAFFNESTGIAFTDDSEVYKTTDAGLNWTEIVTHPFFGYIENAKIFIVNETTAYVAQRADKVFKTTDAGATWTSTTTGFGLNWNAIHFFDAQNGLMAGEYSTVVNNQFVFKNYLIKTSNGGTSWSKVTDLPNSATSLKFINATDGYLVGTNGMFLKTTNKGTSWTAEDIGYKGNLNNLFYFENNLFVTGDEYAVLKKVKTPLANFVGPAQLCEGDSLQVLNNSTDASSFLWLLDNETISTVENLKTAIQEPGVYTLALVSGDCHLSTYDIQTQMITINPNPEKPILTLNDIPAVTQNKLCDTAYTIGSQQPYFEHRWSNGITQPEFTYNNETSLSLRVTSAAGCKTLSDTIYFEKQPNPVANFDFRYLWATDEVSFENKSEYADSYQWDFGDGILSSQPDPKHTFSNQSDYTITLIATNPCTSDTLSQKLEFEVILGTDDSRQGVGLLYPNPAKSNGLVTIQAPESSHYTIADSHGKDIKGKTPIQASTITLPVLTPGIYMIRVYAPNGTSKILKLLVH